MANRFQTPFVEFHDENGNPREGCKLYFFLSGTSTKTVTYKEEALSNANLNPIPLDEYGRPEFAIFLQNIKHKVILATADADDTLPTGDDIIWTADPVSASDFSAFSIRKVGAGNPNGSVSGTAGSAGVLPTEYWDYANNILYVCTTTGSTVTAVWTAINAASSVAVPPPQGRLTPTTLTPVISSEVVAGTALYYTPFVGNLVPIYNGASFSATSFAELTLSLAAQHVAGNLYDVFVFNNAGVLTLVTGPAWQTATAGAGARGTGASTTQLARVNGFHVNAVQITGRNGATTYSIGANLATYLGTISIDGTNGQVTCHVGWGQSRKFGIWNAYNRVPTPLKCGDATSSWSYNTNTWRQSRATAGNTLQVLSGLPEDRIDLAYGQYVTGSTSSANNSLSMSNGIGVNSTTTPSGRVGMHIFGSNGGAGSFGAGGSMFAQHKMDPFIGISNIYPLETVPSQGTGSVSYFGTELNMTLASTQMA